MRFGVIRFSILYRLAHIVYPIRKQHVTTVSPIVVVGSLLEKLSKIQDPAGLLTIGILILHCFGGFSLKSEARNLGAGERYRKSVTTFSLGYLGHDNYRKWWPNSQYSQQIYLCTTARSKLSMISRDAVRLQREILYSPL